MRKNVVVILLITVSLALCLALVSCGSQPEIGSDARLSYGKKYILKFKDDSSETERYEALTFKKDGTGKYEYFYRYDYSVEREKYVISGTASFVWEGTSDGAIHVFLTDIKYNDDHTGKYALTFTSCPLYFSENLVYYSKVTGYEAVSTSTVKYVLEGSDLYKARYGND